MGSSLPDLIREARALAAERDRLIETIAHRWARALRGRSLSPVDREEFWRGLAEEAIREVLRGRRQAWAAEAVRREVGEVISRVQSRVEQVLAARGETVDP